MKGFGHFVWSSGAYIVAVAMLTIILLPIQHWEFMALAAILAVLAIIVEYITAMVEKKYYAAKGKTTSKKILYKMQSAGRAASILILGIATLVLVGFHVGLAVNGDENFHTGFMYTLPCLCPAPICVTPVFDGLVKSHHPVEKRGPSFFVTL